MFDSFPKMNPKTADQQSSDRAAAFLEKALSSLQIRDFKSAVDLFEKAILHSPRDPLLYHRCAEALFALKEYKQSQEMNSKSLSIYYENPASSPAFDSHALLSVKPLTKLASTTPINFLISKLKRVFMLEYSQVVYWMGIWKIWMMVMELT